MCVADTASLIDNANQGHPSELEEVDLLTVELEDRVLRVREADERQAMLLPVDPEGVGLVRAEDHDLRVPVREFPIVLTQLRQVPSAVGSEEAPAEDEEDVLCSPER